MCVYKSPATRQGCLPERVMDLKYYSLDGVTVLSVSGAAQTFMEIKKGIHAALGNWNTYWPDRQKRNDRFD